MQIKEVTSQFSVSPQIEKSDVPAIADAGFSKVVNNRPDGEAPDQPPSLHLMTAVSNAGMGYLHVPVSARTFPHKTSQTFVRPCSLPMVPSSPFAGPEPGQSNCGR